MEVIQLSNTEEQAITLALDELGITKQQAEIEILQSAKKGLFGKVKQQAKVRVRLREGVTPNATPTNLPEQLQTSETAPTIQLEAQGQDAIREKSSSLKQVDLAQKKPPENVVLRREAMQRIVSFLETVLTQMGDADIEIKVTENKEGTAISITSPVDVLKGNIETLHALQTIVNSSLKNETQPFLKAQVDYNAILVSRKKELQIFAENVAKSVQKTQVSTVLDVMTAYERKVVHTVLQRYSYLKTESIGREPNRKIQVFYLEDMETTQPKIQKREPYSINLDVKKSVENVTKIKI